MEIKDNKKLISLKEAAKISGYSSDYIGQLIRAGKIPGKQVYTNITWVTTAEAVVDYKKHKNGVKSKEEKKGVTQKLQFQLRRIKIQFNILRLFFQTFKAAIPLLVVLFLSFLVIGIFLVQTFISFPESKTQEVIQPTNEQPLTF